MARPAISLEMDFSEGYAALGFIHGMSTTISTDRYIDSVISMAHAKMAEQFDTEMDALAMSNRSAFHHVYEWRMIGLPEGRLWRHKMMGRGANREATFEWVASKTPILTPEERMSDPLDTNDPMQYLDPAILARIKPRSYFFYWKAPMMEYDLAARVRPRYAKRLFVPTQRSKEGYIFAMETYQDFSAGNPQDGSGPGGTVGRFTSAWVGWWNTSAPAVFEERVQTVVEKDLGLMEKEIGRKTRRRNVKFGLSTFTNAENGFAAFESGKNRAAAIVMGKADSYKKASKYIDKYGTFGEDVRYAD